MLNYNIPVGYLTYIHVNDLPIQDWEIEENYSALIIDDMYCIVIVKVK